MSQQESSSPLSLERARERYRREREKRIRPDGVAQFQDLSGDWPTSTATPSSTPDLTRDPVDEEVEVLVMGGGFAGMLTPINLKAHGVHDVRILDKAGDFGGTWYWNRYPGCMCDVESYTYLPLLEETGYMPTEKYAERVGDLRVLPAHGPSLRPLPPCPVLHRGRGRRVGRGRRAAGTSRPAGGTTFGPGSS